MNNHHLDIVKKIHKGHSKILIVKIKSKLYIWKRPKSGSHSCKESIKRQLKRIEQWRKFGVSNIDAILYYNGILKTWVEGKTLRSIMKKRHFFSKNSEELNALKNFIKLLIDSRHFIHDMKGANIVFDGKNWQVIDSGPIHKMDHSLVKKEYKKILYQKWSKSLDSHNERRRLKSFLDSF